MDPDPEQTVRPPDRGGGTPELLSTLPRFDSGTLSYEGTLGEGGMGIVHLARQRELGRTVAVKTLKRAHRTASARQKMLQEAWAAGCLEHPNIVPVYALGLDSEDMPCIVLKHIEGLRWADLLAEPDERCGDDPLSYHLEVLEAVGQAIAYAHDRGVVHRDLKPTNVMIGAFGEVTLLDWGLAIAVEGGDGRLPRAEDEHRLAGTPYYMAPEQLAEGDVRCSRATDVYLLGSVFYQVLHGIPPHRGGTVYEILDAVRSVDPVLDESLDDEVRGLLSDCMARDPSKRPTATAFLERLRGWREHRGARALADQAEAELRLLEAELAAEEPDPERVLARFGAVRFGYEQALRVWPHAAPGGLARAARAMVPWYLGLGQVQAARWLLDETDVDVPELEEQVSAAMSSKASEDARLEALAAQHDDKAGIRTRIFVVLVLGALWALLPVGMAIGEALGVAMPVTYPRLALSAGSMALLVWAFTAWARDSLAMSAINLTTKRGLRFAPITWCAAVAWGWAAGLEPVMAMSVVNLGFFGSTAMVVAQLGPRYLPMTLGFLVASLVSAVRPDWVWLALSTANLIFAINVVEPFAKDAWRAYVDDL